MLLGGVPTGAAAQVFLAPASHPDFMIGPLYIRAAVAPTMTGPLTVDIFWSLVIPAKRSAADVIDGDLFLLWPSAVLPAPGLGAPDPALAKYVEQRARVVRLADDPAQLRIDFAKADHVKIDEISPPSARRQLSETQDNTETVTLFLDRSEGIRPQTLTVQFGYFSDLQSWAPI